MWCSVWIMQNLYFYNYDMCTRHFIDFVFCLVIFFCWLQQCTFCWLEQWIIGKRKKNPYILLIGTTYIFELQKLINVQMISIPFPFHSFKLCRPEFIFLCNLKNIKLTGSMHRSPPVYLTTPLLPHFHPSHPCGPKSNLLLILKISLSCQPLCHFCET